MANKKLRFVALIAVVLMLVCMLVACTTTATSSVSYKVTIHSDGQSDIVWDRQTDFPTLSKEHHTVAGLYLDAEYKTAVTPEDLVNMFLTGDIDVYVKYDRIHYSITVHPLNGGSDVIWQNAPGNKIPEFKKVGYVMSGFYFDENCTQPADSVFTEDILENKEVWVKWVECDHKALAPTDWTTDKKATCTEDGHKVATCPTCDKTLEDTIDALGHNQDGSITHKDADCTNSGVVGGTYCTRCNNGKDAAETTIPVDPTKHSFGEWVNEVPATCVSTGTKGHKDCSVCQKSFTANNVEITDLTINATGHSYGNVVYVWADDYSTCTAKHVCENGTCEHEETATATVSPQKTQEATCQQVELTTYTATFTASWAKTQVVEDVKTAGKADHNYSEDWTIDKVATCTEDGSKSHHCLTEGCDSKSDVTTIAASHTYGEWIDEVPATCVSTGTKGHKDCSVCKKHFDNEGNEIAELTIDKSAHSTTHTDKVDATCSVAGNIEYWYCSVCETYYSDEACTTAITVNDTVIPATGEHTYTFVAEVPSTQTEAGTKAHYHCDGCEKDFDLNKVEVTESDLVIEAGKKATYTSTIVIGDYATTNGWVAASGNSGTQYNHVENDIFTVNVSYKTSGATNTGKYYKDDKGNQWRIYESDDPSIVIAATKSEYKLTKLIVTFVKDNNGVLLNGTEQVDSEDKVGITGDSITLGVGHSSGSNKGQARITKIQVEFSFQTDADIAAEDLAKAQEAADELESAIDDMKKEYGADGTYDVLPTTDKNGATVTWSVDENNFCSITEDGKLSIVKPTVEQGNQQITLTATIKVGDQTVTKTVIITITAGVAQHTLTISEDKDYIRIVVEDADGNIIDGDTTVDEGTTLTITVTNTDAENYAIVKVLAGTNELTKNEDGTYTFTIIEDTEISVETKLNLVCKVEGATLKTYAELITLTPSSGDSSEMYYTIGYVNSITNDTYGNMYIEDADGNKLLVYGTYNCDGTVKYADLKTKPAVGDVVVLYGVMTKYNTTYEMKDARILQINLTVYTPATSTITINATGASNATVAVGTTTVDSTSDFTATNGSEFTFTVTVEENYQATVTASVGTVTSGDNGVYTITVTANTTITIVTSEVEGGDEGGGTGTDTPSTDTVTNYEYTFEQSIFTKDDVSKNYTLENVVWSLDAGEVKYTGYDGTKGQQIGSSNDAAKTITLTTSDLKNFNKIVLNLSTANKATANVTVEVGGEQWGATETLTTAATDYTFNSPTGANNSGTIKITITQTTAKAIYIKSISVTGASSTSSGSTGTEGGDEGGSTIDPIDPTDPTPTVTYKWEKVTSVDNLVVGDKIIIKSGDQVMGGLKSGYFEDVGKESDALVLEVVAGNQNNSFAFKTTESKYIQSTNAKTMSLTEMGASGITDAQSWTVEIEEENAIIKNCGNTSLQLQYNTSSPRFTTYTSSQAAIQIYKQVEVQA